MPELSTQALRRVQRILGFGPLSAFVLYHLWEHWPIRHGQPQVLERVSVRLAGLPVAVEILWFVLPLVLHAAVGAWSWRRERGAVSMLSRNQRAAGLVLGAFLAWHVGSLWVPAWVDGGGALAAMAIAEGQLDSLYGQLAYALGWSALAAHVGYGVLSVMPRAETSGPSRTGAAFALLAGFVLWLVGLDVLTAYVAGEALF